VRLDDPELVAREYACEERLLSRVSAYRFAEGPDPRQAVVEAVAEASPQVVLEVGSGTGELAERLVSHLGVEVVALDQSERMVALTRARGVEAQVGDVQALPFEDCSFDCAVAAWMLYHVPDLELALAELARVIRPGGRLVATTNAPEHLGELAELLGAERPSTPFDATNAARHLRRHFARVARRECYGSIVFPSRAEAQAYVDSTIVFAQLGNGTLPEFRGPLRVKRAPVVFVCERA
jgi:SAM-dependent methyltransferase